MPREQGAEFDEGAVIVPGRTVLKGLGVETVLVFVEAPAGPTCDPPWSRCAGASR